LCFASPHDFYKPKTAEPLAVLSVTQDRRRIEREDKKWAEENLLFPWAGLVGREPPSPEKPH